MPIKITLIRAINSNTRDWSLCLKLGTAFHFALSTSRHTKPSTLHGPYHLRFPAHLYSVSIAQILRVAIYRLQVHIHCTYPSARHPLRSSSLRFPLAGRLATGAPVPPTSHLQGTINRYCIAPVGNSLASPWLPCSASFGPLVPCCRALLVCICRASGTPQLHPSPGTH
jgi:hypothetical protein